MDDEILTAEQVANILKVHRFTVLKFIKQGKLKASKLGRVYRIRKSEVDRFLDDQIEHTSHTAKKTSSKKKVAAKKRKSTARSEKKQEEPESSVKPKKQPQQEDKKGKEEEPSPRKNDNDVDHYVLKIHDQHDI